MWISSIKETHLKLHGQAIHDGKKFQCPECEYLATQKGHLATHHKSIHMGQKFQCPDCVYLASHLVTHHIDYTFGPKISMSGLWTSGNS